MCLQSSNCFIVHVKKKGLINAMLLKPHVFVIYEWPHTELVRTCFDIVRQASINSIF